MALELARAQALSKPWGVVDLRPWSEADHGDLTIGEIWYERPDADVSQSSQLLLKLLFTSQPLSIQVHPDNAFAQSIGISCGKTEAWYIVSAAPGSKIALGLRRQLSALQLREAIVDGSIVDLVAWKPVATGDVVYVPAGTIHAIGAGLVIAEIQQRSDATFRLFDFGRERELHIENAVAVADAGPIAFPPQSNRLTDERTLLATSPYFAFERIDLPPNCSWRLEANQESWLLVLSGSAHVEALKLAAGTVVFAQSDQFELRVGALGMMALVGYAGSSPAPQLLQPLTQSRIAKPTQPEAPRGWASVTHATASLVAGQMTIPQ